MSDMSKLALELIEKEKRERTGKLDLGNCGLTELPEELFELFELEELMLSNITWNFEKNIGIYSKNKGVKNNISVLSSSFSKLRKLKKLYIGQHPGKNWPITDITPLKELVSLEYLNLHGNCINDINPLKKLEQLKTLDLSNNEITDIQAIQYLHRLEFLNLSFNDVFDLDYLSNLTSLKSLLLAKVKRVYNSENNEFLLTIAKEMQVVPLKDNKELNQIFTIEEKFSEKPFIFLEKLINLKQLDLSLNNIVDISILKKLRKIKKLSLRRNKIEDISVLKNYGAIDYLLLEGNNIYDLSPLLNLFKSKKHPISTKIVVWPKNEIELSGNPLGQPPLEIVKQGNQAILNYFKELEKGDQPNNQIKMIIVGNGRVGKTSLLKRLKNKPYNAYEKFTHGIQIEQLQKEQLPESKTEELALNVWDFGGQEIFYATHQFFLSEEALYLLAWTNEANVKLYRERDKATLPPNEKWRSKEYWLENIRLRSKTSPIVMVQTHSDIQKIAINESDYAEEPYQATCLSFSAKKDYGLAELKDTITQKINNELPLYGQPFPMTYNNVIEEIERLKNEENVNYISYQYFVDTICRNANISEGGEATLCAYLNNTGVVVHYPDNPQLKDKVYINPNWLTQQVYCLINNRLIALEGKFDISYLQEYLSDYQETGLLELLKAFKLIFEVEKKGKQFYIAPQYLPKSKEDDLDLEKDRSQLAFIFHFPKFIPDNVMVNFLSSYGSLPKSRYWKDAIFFIKYGAGCIVEEKENSLFVYTDTGGDYLQLQREVCRAFVELSRHANAHISLDGEVFVEFSILKKLSEERYRYITSVCGKKLSVADFRHFFNSNTDYDQEELKEAIVTIKRILSKYKNQSVSDDKLLNEIKSLIYIENITVNGGKVQIGDKIINQ